MKRLFGLIGLTYLSVLAVVFYCYSQFVLVAVFAAAAVTIIAFVFIKVKTETKISVAAVCITAVCACLSIVIYTNCVYLPITNKYSDEEIKISGYVCEEVQNYYGSMIYTVKTDTVNGENENIKIQIISYTDLKVDDFDEITADLHVYQSESSQYASKGIFLKAYTYEDFSLESTGKKHITPYFYAVAVRKAMKAALDELLPEDYSSLCKAVLLGDKNALPYDMRSDFTNTGTSFLIVVSGMHLSVITAFVLFLTKKITKNKAVICVFVCFTVVFFMALTGFSSSVVRSGIMLILTYCATVFLRKSDALNSMGIAALALTAANPYAVGDIGMLMSFAATAGIILWSKNIEHYIAVKLKLKRKFLNSVVSLISVSLSASLWIIPITVVAFGRVSPFTVVVATVTEPLVSTLIVCAFLSAVLYLCPIISFLAYPFALAAGVLGKLIIFIESAFASIPYCSINADKPYFYIWLVVTILLTIIGIFVKSKPVYIKYTVITSFTVLIAGWAVFTVISENTAEINIRSVGNGVTASVESGGNVTLLSCGGDKTKADSVIESLERKYTKIDNIIIPDNKNKYSAYQSRLINEFDVSNILLYDNDSSNGEMLSEYDGQSRSVFGNNIHFTLNLSKNITCDVFCLDDITYQFVSGNCKTLLFISGKGDISALPENFRNADYLLTDVMPDNTDLLECDTVIFSGNVNRYEDVESSFKELFSNVVTTSDGDVTINLNDGG